MVIKKNNHLCCWEHRFDPPVKLPRHLFSNRQILLFCSAVKEERGKASFCIPMLTTHWELCLGNNLAWGRRTDSQNYPKSLIAPHVAGSQLSSPCCPVSKRQESKKFTFLDLLQLWSCDQWDMSGVTGCRFWEIFSKGTDVTGPTSLSFAPLLFCLLPA